MTTSLSVSVPGEEQRRKYWSRQHLVVDSCCHRDSREGVVAVAELENHTGGSRP